MVLLLIGILPGYLNAFYNPRLMQHPREFWTVEVLTWIVLPLAIYLWGMRRGVFTNAELGLSLRVCGTSRRWAFAVALIVTPSLFLWVDPRLAHTVVEHISVSHRLVDYDYKQILPAPGPETGLLRLLATLEMALTAGVVEEFYYRGMMRRLFGRGCFGAILFVIVSSLLFAGSHFEWGEQKLAYAFGWGIIMGSIYAATGNLWPVILGHTLVDLNWLV